MSIKDLREKIKSSGGVIFNGLFTSENLEKTYISVVILLVGLSSFGLGRLSVSTAQNSGVVIEKVLQTTENTVSQQAAGVSKSQVATPSKNMQKSGQYVASKNGSKYYFPWCGGANNISETNKIWFETVEDAKSKGYLPASNCKGLK